MIDIETDKEPNLKHIRQMGSPAEGDRIYIENAAYARVHEEDYAKQRAFIFMGHTECREGAYTTFIEAAIPVRDLTFSQNIPSWNTHVWSDVFREIKRSYENSIIVGWALDCKGFAPRMTPALEAVHSEQFGGAHQVLLLMDTLEGEEYFFQNRGSHLQQKEGFYIYYARELHQVCPAEVTVEMAPRESVQAIPEKDPPKTDKKRSYAMVAAVAMLVVILGLGLVQGQISLPGIGQAVQAMSERVQNGISSAEWLVGTEQTEAATGATEATETLNLIPIEQIPAGDITKLEDAAQSETQQGTQSSAQQEEQADGQQGTQDSTQQEAQDDGQQGAQADAANEAQDDAQATVASEPTTYIVQRGDTLTGISLKLYGTNRKAAAIAELNELENSDDIREGQKLLLP